MSRRAFGRLLLVFVFVLLVAGVHGAVEERLGSGDAHAALEILLASVLPATVTYFWCAALQRRVGSVAWRAGVASTIAGTLLLGLPLLAYAFSLAASAATNTGSQDHIWASIIVFGLAGIAAVVAAPIVGWIAVGISGQIGGIAIDFARRRKLSAVGTVGLLALVLCATNAIVLLSVTGLDWAFEAPNFTAGEQMGIWLSLLTPLGWAGGLLVSGFPSVLEASTREVPLAP